MKSDPWSRFGYALRNLVIGSLHGIMKTELIGYVAIIVKLQIIKEKIPWYYSIPLSLVKKKSDKTTKTNHNRYRSSQLNIISGQVQNQRS